MTNESVNKFLSRKYTLALIIIGLASILLVFSTLTGAMWAATVGTVYSGYAIANVAQDVLAKKE